MPKSVNHRKSRKQYKNNVADGFGNDEIKKEEALSSNNAKKTLFSCLMKQRKDNAASE